MDELCEKLKEINQNNKTKEPKSPEQLSEDHHLSPQDSAKRYYAAFPPLIRNTRPLSPSSYIALIPKWPGSPKKKAKRQSRSSSYEEKFHCKIDSDGGMKSKSVGKQRYACFSKNKRELGYCRNVAKSMERSESMKEWDLYMFKNSVKGTAATNWPKLNKGPLTEKDVPPKVLSDLSENLFSRESSPGIWSEHDDNMNMYDDLPVDIRQLLNSPVKGSDNVEMMNMANMRDTGKKTFLSCGFNVGNSIWSNETAVEDMATFDNNFNSVVDKLPPEEILDLQFGSITIDNGKSSWSSTDATFDNEKNLFYENLIDNSFAGNVNFDNGWLKITAQKWSDGENELELLEKSLAKINHSKETSSFVEVLPKPNRGAYEVFNSASASLKISIHTVIQNGQEDTDDDLLSSDFTHFRPINENTENKLMGKYANGTTFVIPSTFEIPNYKRSESGSTYLDDEFGLSKKYQEYKKNSLKEFILKFSVSLNDKACQTDKESDGVEVAPEEEQVCQNDMLFPGDNDILVADAKQECTCSSNKDNAMNLEFSYGNEFDCPVHTTRPDSMTAEIFGKTDAKCDHCNKNSWNAASGDSSDAETDNDKKSIKNIWNGGEFCLTCLGLNNSKPKLSLQQYRLREDVSHDGEQLLSDLSNFQKAYMDELPISEVSCDITELLGAGERKRRHSIMNSNVGEHTIPDSSFSFASRLEEDVLITMTSIPTLRSVTL